MPRHGVVEIKLTLSTVRQASAFLAFLEANGVDAHISARAQIEYIQGQPPPSSEVFAAEDILQRGGLRTIEPVNQSEAAVAFNRTFGLSLCRGGGSR